MPIEFDWDMSTWQDLFATVHDNLSKKYMDIYFDGLQLKDSFILEAGCGSGRYVKYIDDCGLTIVGLEINCSLVVRVHTLFPDLRLICGDICNMPLASSTVAGLICLGVVEHFPEGPHGPLSELYRVTRPGGVMIVTIPSYNYVRQIKAILFKISDRLNPKRNNLVRRLFGRKELDKTKYLFTTVPRYGGFFEYEFTHQQFESELRKAGWTILESIPDMLIDGIYHDLNPGKLLVKWDNEKYVFQPSLIAKKLNGLLSKFRWLHNHMHLCIVRK
jgi:SAM-dependent methyltransferase